MKKLACLALLTCLFAACSTSSNDNWTAAVPDESTFLIVPSPNATIDTVLQAEYLPALEDMSSSAIQLMADIDSTAGRPLNVESIILYPGATQHLQPVWIVQGPDDFEDRMLEQYSRRFTKNEYRFHGKRILDLTIKDRHVFAARLSNFLLISESSSGLENAIRAYSGSQKTAGITPDDVRPGTFIINTPALNQWVAQLARVQYHPRIKHLFEGTSPASFSISEQQDEEEQKLQIAGTIGLNGNNQSKLIRALSQANRPITLDEYISSTAAGFSILHSPPAKALPASLPDTTALDNALIDDQNLLAGLSAAADTELAMVMYSESGFLSTGEHLYIRKLSDATAFRSQLEQLHNRGLIEKSEGIYSVQSNGMSHLFTSGFSGFKNFYINITGDAAVISKRKGLAELVASDRNRRRVVAYEPYYEDIQAELPDELSSLFIAGPEFNTFMESFLSGSSYIDALFSGYNYITLTTKTDAENKNLSLNISAFNSENGNRPYRENWLRNAGGAPLSGPPAFGNIGGSSDDEVVYATETGNIYAVAADGTIANRYNTGRDEPVGSPVVYDWYGTGQNVVLIAAGNKIYGWDENGDMLPKFPLELSERITTPLTVTDLNNNRMPNAIVGTADRRLHVLNGRGENLSGWPVSTNTPVTAAPLTRYFQGVPAVVTFTSNAVHAWNATGKTLPGFPAFMNASLQDAPALFEGSIIGNGIDGKLYAIGDNIPFSDSLNTYRGGGSNPATKAVNISGSALSGTPQVYDNMILTAGQNGSVFLLNADGSLSLTRSMGQPIAPDWSPRITDINSDGQADIVALANYGRLYAWQLSNGERLHNLPTAGMNHVQIGDLDGDGLKELVAQTEEGVRCWTINR